MSDKSRRGPSATRHSRTADLDYGRRTIEFDDNRLISTVFGQHDRNLARLEQQLGVVLVNRGNRVAIEASADKAGLAAHVLEELYSMAERGHHIEVGDVDGVVRMAQNGKTTLHEDAFSGPQAAAGMSAHGKSAASGTDQGLRIATRRKEIVPRSPGQVDYMHKLMSKKMVFGVGPAGTGKTYIAVTMAVSRLVRGEVNKIILSRPAVEAGENLGFLPGDLQDKLDPYMRPLYDALEDHLSKDQIERFIAEGKIEIAPLAYMRGRTLSKAHVILDEAQNTTKMQMKMFLTRFGEDSRMVICGDASQTDLPRGTVSGLNHALNLLSGIDDIGITRFGHADVVRHPLVGVIARAYENENRDATDSVVDEDASSSGIQRFLNVQMD